MRRLTAAEVHAQKVKELGLDPNALDLTSIEAVAGALRRTANFLCPCTAATLVRGVVRPLRGLVDDTEAVRDIVAETLEAMIAHGDILEHRVVQEDSGYGTATLLYAAPASFVVRESGAVLLFGVSSDQLSALPDDLEKRVEYVNHLRRLNSVEGEDLRADLGHLGLIEISYDQWLKAPRTENVTQYLSRLDQLLDAAQPSGHVTGLLLLDPESSVRYYRGRWTEVHAHSGRYVARRRQAYGADLWCYVQIDHGNAQRFIDFPIDGSRWRGCDEAWRLQMAIDAQRGEPQRFRVRPALGGTHVIEFFSPVPMWARRRWDAIGVPVLSPGCLFAYRLAEPDLAEEIRFAREALWLGEV